MKTKKTRLLLAILFGLSVFLTACHTDRPDNHIEANLRAKLTEGMVAAGLPEQQAENVLTVYQELGGDYELLADFAYDAENRALTAVYDDFYTLELVFDEDGILNDVSCQYFDADDRHHYVFYEDKEAVAPFEKWFILKEQRNAIVFLAEYELYAYNDELTAIEASEEAYTQWHFDKIPHEEMSNDIENLPDLAYYGTTQATFTYADSAQDTGQIYIIIYAEGDEWVIHSLTVSSVNAPCNMDGTIIGD